MAGRTENPDIFLGSISKGTPCTIPSDLMGKFNDSLFSTGLTLVRDMRIFYKKPLSNSTLDGFGIPFFLNFPISCRFIRMIFPPLGGGSGIGNLDTRGRNTRAFIRAKVKMPNSIIRENGLTFPAWPFSLDCILSFVMPLCTAKVRTKSGTFTKGNINLSALFAWLWFFWLRLPMNIKRAGNWKAVLFPPCDAFMASIRASCPVNPFRFKFLFTSWTNLFICFHGYLITRMGVSCQGYNEAIL